jgi:GMP synthase-like glutamine amidotransferase
MLAHYLQHVRFEGLGSIEGWLRKAGYEISSTAFFDGGVLPNIEEIDLLIVMGGPMSVNDESEYPWLVQEKAFVRQVIEAGKPVLGVCLGAQLIASALGGQVFANAEKEIGWFPVAPVESDAPDVFRFPEETHVFHWHGETFSLPPGAVQIARSRGCENQAFQIGRNVIGLQFHLETTPASAQGIVENCADELVDARYIQTASEILAASEERYLQINRLMVSILEHLTC